MTAAIISWLPTGLWSQTAAAAEGDTSVIVTVRTELGVLSGATVKLTPEDNGTKYLEFSDSKGDAIFTGLEAGTYSVAVSLTGFTPYEERNITLRSGEERVIKAILVYVQFGEITVIATKRKRDLQQVPLAVTAVSDLDLERRTATNIDDALQTVPNVIVNDYALFAPTYAIRGVSSSTNNVGIEPGVGFYLDEVYLSRPASFNRTLMDVERIEVLRGPQGTLFGKNTVGGLVNIITSRPQNQLSFAADIQLGNYDLTHGRVHITGPVAGEKVRASFTAVGRQRDGWMENRAPGGENLMSEDFWGVSGKLEYLPNDRVDVLLSIDYSEDRNIDNTMDVHGGYLYEHDGMDVWDRSIATNEDDFYRRDFYGAALRATFSFGKSDLISLTGFRSFDSEIFHDQDYTDIDILPTGRAEALDYFSQEFRLVSTSQGRFSYVGGLFFSTQNTKARDQIFFGEDMPTFQLWADIGIVLPPIPGYEESITASSDLEADTSAAFFSGGYDLGGGWNLSGGLRYTYEQKSVLYEQQTSPFLLDPDDPSSAVGLIYLLGQDVPLTGQEFSDGDFSGDISLRYDVTPRVMPYALLSRGFKAGGFDTTISSTSDPGDLSFDSEYVTSFELGIKSTFAASRVKLNLAGFYLDYTDKQEQTFDGQSLSFRTGNAAEATSKGLELELFAVLAQGLDLSGSVGYTDATYDKWIDLIWGDLSGKKLVNSPEWNSSLALACYRRISSRLFISVRGEAIYQSDSYGPGNVTNDDRFVQAAHTLVNGRIAIETAGGRYVFAIWGKNLTGENYMITGTEALGMLIGYVNPPRMYGTEFRLKF